MSKDRTMPKAMRVKALKPSRIHTFPNGSILDLEAVKFIHKREASYILCLSKVGGEDYGVCEIKVDLANPVIDAWIDYKNSCNN